MSSSVHEMDTVSAFWPRLPVELLEVIISEAWSSPMSKRERTNFFAALCQVSHTWLFVFVHIALKDVHIPCPLSAEDYLRLIRERAAFEPDGYGLMEGVSATANSLCRSMTFHVEHGSDPTTAPEFEPSVLLYSSEDVSANAISSTMYMISTLNYLPNLRRVSIHYVNWGFEDVFEQGRFLVFPDQVTHLDIRFTFRGDSLSALGQTLRERYRRRWYAGVSTPNIRHLSIFGAPIAFVSEMLWTCPNIEVLDIDGTERLTHLLVLPRSLHTLNLHMRPKRLMEKDIERWGLEDALLVGMFSCTKFSLRIVVYSGPPEPAAWDAAKKMCDRYQVQLLLGAPEIRV